MSNSDEDKALEFFMKLAETQGVACSTVKDGHLLMFKRSFLQEVLNKYADKESITIFVKRPDFKD